MLSADRTYGICPDYSDTNRRSDVDVARGIVYCRAFSIPNAQLPCLSVSDIRYGANMTGSLSKFTLILLCSTQLN